MGDYESIISYIIFIVFIVTILFILPYFGILTASKDTKTKNKIIDEIRVLNEEKKNKILSKYLINNNYNNINSNSELSEEVIFEVFSNTLLNKKSNNNRNNVVDLNSNKLVFPLINNKTNSTILVSSKDIILYNRILTYFKKGKINSIIELEMEINKNLS